MSTEKLVKTRKLHICDFCKTEIEINSEAYRYELKVPKYDSKTGHYDNECNQIGIEYLRWYLHKKCLDDEINGPDIYPLNENQ